MIGSRRAEASENKLVASDFDEEGMAPFGGRRFGNRGVANDTSRTAVRSGNRADSPGRGGERIANMNRAGTTKVVKEFHNRHFILRVNESAKTIAEWSNKLQAFCENEPLGIPAIVGTSNAVEVLGDGEEVTVSCAEGERGFVYEGLLDFDVEEIALEHVAKTKTTHKNNKN